MKFNKMIALSVLVAGMSSALIAGPGEAAVRGAMKEVPDGTVSALAERFNSGDVAKKAKKVAKKVGALPRHLKLGSTEYYKHLHRTLPEHARLRVGRTAKVATGAAVDAFEAAKAKFGPAVEHAKKTAKIIIKQKPGESVEAFIKRMEAALEGREDDYEDVAEELAKAKDKLAHELEERAEELKEEADDLGDLVEDMNEDDEEQEGEEEEEEEVRR